MVNKPKAKAPVKKEASQVTHFRLVLNPVTGTDRFCFSVRHSDAPTTTEWAKVSCEHCHSMKEKAIKYRKDHPGAEPKAKPAKKPAEKPAETASETHENEIY